MMLEGTKSDRFQIKHLCDICEEVWSTFKPKCYEPDSCDVEFCCEGCHNEFCMCNCV